MKLTTLFLIPLIALGGLSIEAARVKDVSTSPIVIPVVVEDTAPYIEEFESFEYDESFGSTKTLMKYSKITSPRSKQYWLKQFYTIDNYGFCRIGDLYSIAVGSYYASPGDVVEVVLWNDKTFQAVVGDQKASKDTINNQYQKHDGSVIEFLVDYPGTDYSANKSAIKELFPGGIKYLTKVGYFDGTEVVYTIN